MLQRTEKNFHMSSCKNVKTKIRKIYVETIIFLFNNKLNINSNLKIRKVCNIVKKFIFFVFVQ